MFQSPCGGKYWSVDSLVVFYFTCDQREFQFTTQTIFSWYSTPYPATKAVTNEEEEALHTGTHRVTASVGGVTAEVTPHVVLMQQLR